MIYCIEILCESVYQSVKFYIINDNPIKVCDLVIDLKSSILSNTNNGFLEHSILAHKTYTYKWFLPSTLWYTVSYFPKSTSCTFCNSYKERKVLTGFIPLRPRQHGRHFADDTFKHIFLNENVIISIKISLKFVPKGPINNIPALVQIMAWRRPGDKPLSEAMMVSLLTHICVTRPQYYTKCGAL